MSVQCMGMGRKALCKCTRTSNTQCTHSALETYLIILECYFQSQCHNICTLWGKFTNCFKTKLWQKIWPLALLVASVDWFEFCVLVTQRIWSWKSNPPILPFKKVDFANLDRGEAGHHFMNFCSSQNSVFLRGWWFLDAIESFAFVRVSRMREWTFEWSDDYSMMRWWWDGSKGGYIWCGLVGKDEWVCGNCPVLFQTKP